ncbi:MAG TPA: YbjQ family protein [Devosiaceae bacterium]|nr:YbjQ family protein [Devosiaceae bacterium]
MLTTTTDVLEGFEVTDYLGLVTGESILGANILRDVLGTVTDYVGGRSAAYEEVLERARHEAVEEMTDRARVLGADAVIGAALDYETIGSRGAMLMVTVAGTAVRLRKK